MLILVLMPETVLVTLSTICLHFKGPIGLHLCKKSVACMMGLQYATCVENMCKTYVKSLKRHLYDMKD